MFPRCFKIKEANLLSNNFYDILSVTVILVVWELLTLSKMYGFVFVIKLVKNDYFFNIMFLLHSKRFMFFSFLLKYIINYEHKNV